MSDKLVYFPARARAEAIRMLYVVAGEKFDDSKTGGDAWAKLKPETPLGSVPILTTSDGVLCMSNVIARHVADKLGLAGSDKWEKALHDLVVECAQECMNIYAMPGIYKWLVFKLVPTPEDSEEILQKAKDQWIKILNYIQSVAEKRGKKYIVGDELGLAELWLYAGLEFCKVGNPEIMTLTPWTKQFTEKVEAHPTMKKYLAERPVSSVGL